MNRLVLVLMGSVLVSCASPPAEQAAVAPSATAVSAPVRSAAAGPGKLGDEAQRLSGVVIERQEPLTLSYPEQTLFAEGAALPLPGGVAVLDPLADFLSTHPETRWRMEVRAKTGLGADYDQRLAGRRAELVSRFLAKRGVRPERLSVVAEGGEGAPLVLILQSP